MNVSINEIINAVSSHYDIPKNALLSGRRSRAIAWPRQVGYFLAKHHSNRSFPEIGRMFGGRDHTTILHGVKRVNERLDDQELVDDIKAIRYALSLRSEPVKRYYSYKTRPMKVTFQFLDNKPVKAEPVKKKPVIKEAIQESPAKPKTRKCLQCSSEFEADSPLVRVCKPCKGTRVWRGAA